MRNWIVVLIILAPILEILGILQVGDWIGGWNTFVLLLLIGALGAFTALMEIRKVMEQARHQMNQGQIPGRSFINGVCILVGGVLLLIPGFISDIFGILLLLPFTRPLFQGVILKWIEKRMRNGSFTIRRY